MNHLSSATQQTASASEELSATAEELSAQAQQLQELMSFFQLAEGPGAGNARSKPSAAIARAPVTDSGAQGLRFGQTEASGARTARPSGATYSTKATAEVDEAAFTNF
jgi:hypothetical protein